MASNYHPNLENPGQEEKVPRLVSVNDQEGLRRIGCFYKKATLYDYKSRHRLPDEIFVKIGRKLLIRTAKWIEYVKGSNNLDIEELIRRG